MILKKGLAMAVDAAVEAIKENSRQVQGKADIARVASISANDEYIGN